MSNKRFSKKEIERFLESSINEKITVKEQVEFLESFTPEKVIAEELKIFADFMIKKMTSKLKMPMSIDICGTGGSGLKRINTSTIASFVLAQLGVGVAKHGNKAASGRFGSFDLLEALGLEIEKEPGDLEKMYVQSGLAFIYARKFHPVMRFFAEARAKIGKPTIFNILGPLLNPANPTKQIIGTSFGSQMKLIAEACKMMNKKRVFVVRGNDGLDEVTLTGKTHVVELNEGEILEYDISPKDFGVKKCDFRELMGGDLKMNSKIALKILEGKCTSRHADLVYVNVALALKLAGKIDDLASGYTIAKNTLGIYKLEEYRGSILAEIASKKSLPISDRDFAAALKQPGVSLIAEIKKASPSEGEIFKGKFDVGRIAKLYEKSGVRAISVLTDEKHFRGSFDYLRAAKDATSEVPILCKDFIVQEYQIYKAREYGADAILLIAALLSAEKIDRFLKIAASLGMDCLVEVHNENELKNVLKTSAKIIGINNRDLTSFKVDLRTTNRLIKMIPRGKIIVSESGISRRIDIEKFDKRLDAVLIGTSIMRSTNITKKIHELTKKTTAK